MLAVQGHELGCGEVRRQSIVGLLVRVILHHPPTNTTIPVLRGVVSSFGWRAGLLMMGRVLSLVWRRMRNLRPFIRYRVPYFLFFVNNV